MSRSDIYLNPPIRSPISPLLVTHTLIMALRYGIPIFLEDQSGRLTGSEYVDLYNRKKFTYRRISRDSAHPTYGIFDNSPGSSSRTPKVTLEFGSDNSLGTIRVNQSNAIPMDTYLSRVTIFARCHLSMLYSIIACWSSQARSAAILLRPMVSDIDGGTVMQMIRSGL